MDEIETTEPVDGEALPETEVGNDGNIAAETMLDEHGNPTDTLEGDVRSEDIGAWRGVPVPARSSDQALRRLALQERL